MRLFANGCSFTWGGGILEEEYGLATSLINVPAEEKNLRMSLVWPAYLGELLGCEVANLSMGCGSNSRIVRTTLDHFLPMITTGESVDDHLAVIQWTEPSRYEIYDSSVAEWLLIKTDVIIPEVSTNRYDDLQMRLAEDEINHSTRLFSDMVCLSSFFNRWGIRYLFTNFLPLPLAGDHYAYCANHMDWVTGHPAIGMMDLLPPGEMKYRSNHPTPEGHACIARAMHDRLRWLGWC